MWPVISGIVNNISSVSLTIFIISLMLVSSTGTLEHRNIKDGSVNFNNLRSAISYDKDNYISYEILSDGETEKMIHFNGLTAKETSVRPQGDASSRSMKMRQVTDGSHIIQVIYGSDGGLKNCEHVKQRAAVRGFLSSFKETVRTKANVTVLPAGAPLPVDTASWLDFDSLKVLCKRNRRMLKKVSARKSHHRSTPSPSPLIEPQINSSSDHQQHRHHKTHGHHHHRNRKTVNGTSSSPTIMSAAQRRRHRADSFIERSGLLLAPGTKWCGHSDSADTVTSLGPFSETDRCCRNHDLCPLNIPGLGQKYSFFNYRPFTVSHCACDSRTKRGLMEVLRVPGTKWCGKGTSAVSRNQLGGFGAADKCCRAHDTACPFYIPAFELKYGLYNWRLNTLMHCSCDLRFRACLKMANTGTAHLVGKMFFNVVQTKCFVLKPEKMCVKRTWRGKCQRYEYKKQAHLRDNPSF